MMTPTSEPVGNELPSLSRWFRVLIVGLVVARGVVELCVTPLFEGWDEYQHVAYVVHYLETGRRAVFNQTRVPPSLLTAIRGFPQSPAGRAQIPGDYQPESHEAYWRRATGETPQPATADPLGPAPRVRLYQAQHSWWYYAMVGPVFRALGGVENPRLSVGGLRLLNLGFTAAAVWVALGVAAARVRSRRIAGWMGLAIGLQPLFLMNGVRVSSDAAGVFLAVLAVSWMMKLAVDDRRLIARSCGLGPLVGAAIMMKATNFALLPPLAVCWLVALFRLRPAIRRGTASALALGLGIAAVVGPEVGHNLATYGIATSMAEAIKNHDAGRGFHELLEAFRGFPLLAYYDRLFTRGLLIAGGWSFVAGQPEIERLYAVSVHLALLGWLWPLASLVMRKPSLSRAGGVFDSRWTPAICGLVCVSYAAALGYHALQCLVARGVVMTGPWYAAPIIPWFLVLIVAGASRWPWRAAPALMATMLAACLAAEQWMLWAKMLPVYSGGAAGAEALRRITSLQPFYLTPLTAALATLAGAALLAAAVVSIGGVDQEEATPLPALVQPVLPPPWRVQPGRSAADGPHHEPGRTTTGFGPGATSDDDLAEKG